MRVVKLGGSLSGAPELKAWLAALAGAAGRVVLVPGGGPFADAPVCRGVALAGITRREFVGCR